jgi:hypothetical protein
MFISNPVGVDGRSTTTDYRAKDGAFLTTHRSAEYCARTCSDTSGKFVAVLIPE